MEILKSQKMALGAMTLLGLAACREEYDWNKYEELRSSGELSDVIHDWMHEYIETFCRVGQGGTIECE